MMDAAVANAPPQRRPAARLRGQRRTHHRLRAKLPADSPRRIPPARPGEQARTVASQSFLIDEFLAKLKAEGNLNIGFKDTPKQILFHAHCHQRSLAGTASSLNALRLAPGYSVELTNAGCCGMAGSFGYEKEHYDISMTIGSQYLFPQVNAKSDDWEVAVMGVSCRQQIEHGTGRRARHLAEVLAEALG